MSSLFAITSIWLWKLRATSLDQIFTWHLSDLGFSQIGGGHTCLSTLMNVVYHILTANHTAWVFPSWPGGVGFSWSNTALSHVTTVLSDCNPSPLPCSKSGFLAELLPGTGQASQVTSGGQPQGESSIQWPLLQPTLTRAMNSFCMCPFGDSQKLQGASAPPVSIMQIISH